MKNKLLSIVMVSVLATPLFAASGEQRLRVGFEAGMTFSGLSTPKDILPENRSGFAAGVSFEVPIVPIFSIQPEAVFVQRNVTLAQAGTIQLDAKYNSLEFPLLAKLKLDQPISPYLVAGPVMILNISRSVEARGPNNQSTVSFNPRTVDFALAFGGGVDIGPFFAQARYMLGVAELDENSAEWRSRGFHILAGLRI
jgi:hypothetical protein